MLYVRVYFFPQTYVCFKFVQNSMSEASLSSSLVILESVELPTLLQLVENSVAISQLLGLKFKVK